MPVLFYSNSSFQYSHISNYGVFCPLEGRRKQGIYQTQSSCLLVILDWAHFPQSPLFTDKFLPLLKFLEESHISLSTDMQGLQTEQTPSCTLDHFPLSELPVGSPWCNYRYRARSHGSEQGAACTPKEKPVLESQDLGFRLDPCTYLLGLNPAWSLKRTTLASRQAN